MFENFRQDLIAALLEFTGTFLFLFLGLGGIQAGAASNTYSRVGSEAADSAFQNVPSTSQLMYIATSMGLSLLVSAWAFYRVTGALFNPNVGLALLLVGALSPVRFMLYCIAELAGAIAAVAVLHALLPGPLSFSCNISLGVSLAQAVFIEMFITAALCISVFMLAAEKHAMTPMAPVGIGLTLFVGHLFGVVYTGASMNTARAFGPAVIIGFTHDHWVYWVGPTLGSIIAAGLYTALKHFDYQLLNPGQDSHHTELSPAAPALPFRMSRKNSAFTTDSGEGKSAV